MPPRRCLVAPQNTFIENVIRLCENQNANFVVANARIVDHPIVFASEGFCSLTGYSRYELLQKSANLSIMNGDLTTQNSTDRLQAMLDSELLEHTEILLYKKNAKPMWLSIKTSPIKNEKDITVLVLVITKDITSSKHPIELDTGAVGLGKFARFALSVTRNKVLTNNNSTNQNTTTTPNNAAVPSSLPNNTATGNNVIGNSNNSNNNNDFSGRRQPNDFQSSSLLPKSSKNINLIPSMFDSTSRVVAPSTFTKKDPASKNTQPQQPVSALTLLSQSYAASTHGGWSAEKTSSDQAVPWYKQEAPRTPPHIILHYSRFKTSWDWLVLFLTIYTCVLSPYTASFHSKTSKNLLLVCADTVVDVFFGVDVFLNFHVTFVGPAGEVVSDPKVIRSTYLKKWFIVDLFACLPYDIFSAFITFGGWVNVFSELTLIRLLRIPRVARHVDSYIEYGASVLMLLIVMFVLIAHWFACIWYSIGVLEAHKGLPYNWLQRLAKELENDYYLRNVTSDPRPEEEGTTGSKQEATDSATKVHQVWMGGPSEIMAYSTALYYTLSSMTSIGFGNVAAYTESEKIFTICMMIFGSLLYATIFGNVTTIFQQMYSSTGRYHEMLKNVKEFMELHDVPGSLCERVLDYVVSTWSITKGIDASKVLDYCPADMRADICVHLNRKVFYEQSAFRLASESCLRALAVHFNLSHWAPGDMLFHQGESLESLCFIASGSLEVLQDDEIVAVLSAGDSLGDMFWKEETVGQCRANVRALTYCNLHIIKREPLLEVLKFYQSFANSFARNLRLTYNLRKRLIFRKIADVLREQELAERMKDNPPIDLAMNHPVRKLISRFRKMSTVASTSNVKLNAPTGLQEERGEESSENASAGHSKRGSLADSQAASSRETLSGKPTQIFRPSLWKLAANSGLSASPTNANMFSSPASSMFGDSKPSTVPQSSMLGGSPNLSKHYSPVFRPVVEGVLENAVTSAATNQQQESGSITRKNSATSAPTKQPLAKRWGKLLAAPKAPADACLGTKEQTKPQQKDASSSIIPTKTTTDEKSDDFEKLTFYEMNRSLRNDMMTINTRIGGIDVRLSQILQLLQESINDRNLMEKEASHATANYSTTSETGKIGSTTALGVPDSPSRRYAPTNIATSNYNLAQSSTILETTTGVETLQEHSTVHKVHSLLPSAETATPDSVPTLPIRSKSSLSTTGSSYSQKLGSLDSTTDSAAMLLPDSVSKVAPRDAASDVGSDTQSYLAKLRRKKQVSFKSGDSAKR